MDEIKTLLSTLLEGQQSINAKLDKLDQDVSTLKKDVKDIQTRLIQTESSLNEVAVSMNYLVTDVLKLKKQAK